MREWEVKPYKLTINDDKDPLYTLYFGRYTVLCVTENKNELPPDTCQRVINRYIKHGGYKHWCDLIRIADKDVNVAELKQKESKYWFEYLTSPHVNRLRKLLNKIKADFECL